MQDNIHPKYKKLIINIKDRQYETKSTYPKVSFLMEVDFKDHPAWTGKGFLSANDSDKTVSSFNQKFAGISFGVKK